MSARELEALLARVHAVLRRQDGAPPGARVAGTLGPVRLEPAVDAAFYRLGVSEPAPPLAGLASLRLDGPRGAHRQFLLGLWASGDHIVLATRWLRREARPLLVRGSLDPTAWTEALLERPLEARLVAGRLAFEEEVARGHGHLDSSQDLLSLGG